MYLCMCMSVFVHMLPMLRFCFIASTHIISLICVCNYAGGICSENDFVTGQTLAQRRYLLQYVFHMHVRVCVRVEVSVYLCIIVISPLLFMPLVPFERMCV